MAGVPLEEAAAAMLLVHGRGASAESILDLARFLPHPEMAYLAPQAAGGAWYPNSFLAPIVSNEPGISSGLQLLDELVTAIEAVGIPAQRLVLGGFSQGACLASEYAARHTRRYGGLLIFSGGLIGPLGAPRKYEGTLEQTPVFVGCSNIDLHIPVERVHETADVLAQLGGEVTKKIYAGMGHTIHPDELEHAARIVAAV